METTARVHDRGHGRPRQECLQRVAAVFNCFAGQFDRDHDPLSLCEECPEGKSSPEAATLCTAAASPPPPNFWGEAWTKFTELDGGLQVVCGSGIAVAILAVCGWLCTRCEGGLPGLATRLGEKCGCIEDKDPAEINAQATVKAAEINAKATVKAAWAKRKLTKNQ